MDSVIISVPHYDHPTLAIMAMKKGLHVMDSTAASLCMDNGIQILVFNLDNPQNIVSAMVGETIGTLVK